jgi:uncharacterized protein (DUF362 family)
MIFKKEADNVIEAAYEVTGLLLEGFRPDEPVIIKPNIVEPAYPPVTTDVRVVEGVVKALKDAGLQDIIIAEGSGTGDTMENFEMLGYSKPGVQLVDLDKEPVVKLPVPEHRVWDEIYLPEILPGKFIISVPVLKEHSMCGVTISLKNMVGILPAEHYSGYWTYKKSVIHRDGPDECIADINNIMKPDWAVIDATVGMKGSHISGTPIDPPLNLVYASDNPLEADKYGCELLGRRWESMPYLKMIAEDLKLTIDN